MEHHRRRRCSVAPAALNFPSSLADAPAPAVPSPTAVSDLSRRIWARAPPHPTSLSLPLLFYDVIKGRLTWVNAGQRLLLSPTPGTRSRMSFPPRFFGLRRVSTRFSLFIPGLPASLFRISLLSRRKDDRGQRVDSPPPNMQEKWKQV